MGKPGRDGAPSPVNPGDSATRQEVRLKRPPTRTRWGRYHLADQVAPRGRKASSTRKIKPQTSNLKPIVMQNLDARTCGAAQEPATGSSHHTSVTVNAPFRAMVVTKTHP